MLSKLKEEDKILHPENFVKLKNDCYDNFKLPNIWILFILQSFPKFCVLNEFWFTDTKTFPNKTIKNLNS